MLQVALEGSGMATGQGAKSFPAPGSSAEEANSFSLSDGQGSSIGMRVCAQAGGWCCVGEGEGEGEGGVFRVQPLRGKVSLHHWGTEIDYSVLLITIYSNKFRV